MSAAADALRKRPDTSQGSPAASLVASPKPKPTPEEKRKLRDSATLHPGVSLRIKTVIVIGIFTFVAITTIIFIVGGVFSYAFQSYEYNRSSANVVRVASLIRMSLDGLAATTRDYSVWDDAAKALSAYSEGDHKVTDMFIESNFYTEGSVDAYLGINLFAIWLNNGTLVWGSYNPSTENETVSYDAAEMPAEVYDPGFVQKLLQGNDKWSGLLNMPGLPSMLASVHTVQYEQSGVKIGAMMFAYETKPSVKRWANIVQGCITLWLPGSGFDTDAMGETIPSDARWALEKLRALPLSSNISEFGVHHVTRSIVLSAAEIEDSDRICPDDYAQKSWLIAGYCLGKDKLENQFEGPLIRIDHTRDFWALGNSSMLALVLVIIASILGMDFAFTMSLVRGVLKRLDNLSNMLLEDINVSSSKPAPPGSAALPTREKSNLSLNSSGSDKGINKPEDGRRGDEILRLKRMLEYKLQATTDELAATLATLANERSISSRLDSALRLLNLLCGRDSTSTLPEELLPDVGKPVLISLEGIMADPLAIEFFKAHCRTEGCLENFLFLIDLVHLRRTAGDSTLALQLAPLAAAVFRRYFSEKAPFKLHISSHMRRKIRKAAASCKVPAAIAAYEELAVEIAKTLHSKVLPHFAQSPDYQHMLRTLRTEEGNDLAGQYYSDYVETTPATTTTLTTTSGLSPQMSQEMPPSSPRESGSSRSITGVFSRLRNAFGSPPSGHASPDVHKAKHETDSVPGSPIPLTPLGQVVTAISSDEDEPAPLALNAEAAGATTEEALPNTQSQALPTAQTATESPVAATVGESSPGSESGTSSSNSSSHSLLTSPATGSMGPRTPSPAFKLSLHEDEVEIIETQF